MSLLQDARYGLRQLLKSPAFTLTAVLTLALGVGANTAVFTLVHAVMLKSLPVSDPAQLVRIGDNDNCCVWGGFQDEWGLFSYPLYLQMRDHTPAFQQMAAMQSWSWIALGVRREGSSAAAENFHGEWVSGNYFSTFGISAFNGRTLTPDDDRASAAPAAVLSYRAWLVKLGADPKVVGSNLIIDGHAFTVVGIAPPGFFGDRISSDPPEIFLPLAMEPMLRGDRSLLNNAEDNWLYVIGRLAPGAQSAGLQDQLTTELRQWLAAVPILTAKQRSDIGKQKIKIGPGGGGIANLKTAYQEGLYMLTVASALVLLIACANLANLLLARAAVRRQQISIQMALGASRGRVIRTMVLESIQLAIAGGVAGLVVAYFGTRAMLAIVFREAFVPISTRPSLPVLGFTLAVSVCTGVLFSLVPAWLTSHTSPIEALRGAGRSTRDRSALPQKSLVVTQAALSLVLLAAAGLVTQSLRNLQNQDFGFEKENRYVVSFDPELAGYTVERLPALFDELQRRLMELQGAKTASLSMYIPQGHDNWSESVVAQGHPVEPGQEPGASWTRVSPHYFESIGVPVLRGRPITDQDTATSRRVAVVNEAFVKKVLPNLDPIGQHFGRNFTEHAGDYEIVGVVRDAKYGSPQSPVRPMFFLPLLQTVQFNQASDRITEQRSLFIHTIVVQVSRPVPGMEEKVRHLLSSVDPNLTVLNFRTYEDQVSTSFNQQRLISRLTGVFSLLALGLASVGLYGVTAYRVARRTSEIGIRMALGASPKDVVKMVLRGALSQIGVGLLIGVPLAMGAGRLVASKLYGIRPYDPVIFGAAIGVLALCAVVASAAPARRAASVHPMEALRTE
jgi:macrolide transport system ATP-binding/permease protein